jgi:hypothetical protein
VAADFVSTVTGMERSASEDRERVLQPRFVRFSSYFALSGKRLSGICW